MPRPAAKSKPTPIEGWPDKPDPIKHLKDAFTSTKTTRTARGTATTSVVLPLTTSTVKRGVDMIKALAAAGDYEGAHAAEDELRLMFITWLTTMKAPLRPGRGQLIQIRAIAKQLKMCSWIEFPRVCA